MIGHCLLWRLGWSGPVRPRRSTARFRPPPATAEPDGTATSAQVSLMKAPGGVWHVVEATAPANHLLAGHARR
jgi:hypothetical protein